MIDIISGACEYSLASGWFGSFLNEIAQRNPLNPIKDWIRSRPWDGVDRLPAIYATITPVDDYVPLSKPALDIINQLPRFEGCPWLLPNPASKAKTPYTDLKHPFDTARQAAGLPDVSLHTLRHSAASFMVNAGIDIYAVGRILGHKSIVSSQRYSHLANDTLLAAVEAGAAKMNIDWMGTATA